MMQPPSSVLKQFEFEQYGELKMKLGIGLALFLPRPFGVVRAGIHDFWRTYLSFVGKENLDWARLGGGNRTRKVSPAVFKTIEDWLGKDPGSGDECWISIHNGEADRLGETSLVLEGYGPADEDTEDVSFIDCAYSLPFLEGRDAETLAQHLVELVRHVPFHCGSAGYRFMRSPYAYNHTIGRMAQLSARFQGVEVSASEKMCYWGGKGLTTVNWITFVGDGFLDRLGGRSAVRDRLPAACRLWELDHGLAIQAGDAPVIADVNTGKDELGLWREVYRVLAPIQFVHEDYKFHPFEFDGERTVQWLTRLAT